MSRTYVGSRLRQLRSERGLSQVALAQTLSISASYLNQIEHDARPLTASVLSKITEAFGVDAGFFDSQDDVRLVAELREALLDGMGLKPKVAFTPLRVAVSGAKVSPPLFESMEILGKHSTLARLQSLRDQLSA